MNDDYGPHLLAIKQAIELYQAGKVGINYTTDMITVELAVLNTLMEGDYLSPV